MATIKLSPRMVEWLSEFHIEGGVKIVFLPRRYEKALTRRGLIVPDYDSEYFELTPLGEEVTSELFSEEIIPCAECGREIIAGDGYRSGHLVYCEDCN